MAFKNGLWFRDFQSLGFRPSLPPRTKSSTD